MDEGEDSDSIFKQKYFMKTDSTPTPSRCNTFFLPLYSKVICISTPRTQVLLNAHSYKPYFVKNPLISYSAFQDVEWMYSIYCQKPLTEYPSSDF